MVDDNADAVFEAIESVLASTSLPFKYGDTVKCLHCHRPVIFSPPTNSNGPAQWVHIIYVPNTGESETVNIRNDQKHNPEPSGAPVYNIAKELGFKTKSA